MVKIYTKKGDQGLTSTGSGKRLSKSDPLLHAQGDIDELNCQLGLIAALLETNELSPFQDKILTQQHRLFTIGSLVSLGDKEPPKGYPVLESDCILMLEQNIDEWTDALPPLKAFILPGGSSLLAQIHMARAICRRAERQLAAITPNTPLIQTYINRLSDWLFTLARIVAHIAQAKEIVWEP